MKLKALIFDVDGTLADTEDAHRCAFNAAFQDHGLDWNWSKPKYADLLLIAGGKERLAAYVDSLDATPQERGALRGQIAALHRSKTEHYTRLISEGRVPLRDGVARLIGEAASANVALAIASTTTLANIDALLRVNLGKDARDLFVGGAGRNVCHLGHLSYFAGAGDSSKIGYRPRQVDDLHSSKRRKAAFACSGVARSSRLSIANLMAL